MSNLLRRLSASLTQEKIGAFTEKVNRKVALILIVKKLVLLLKAPKEERK